MENQVEHSTSRDLASRILKVYSAIEASGEALFIADQKGRIEYVNKGFLKLNNWIEDKAIGRSVSDIPHSKSVTLKMLQAMNQGRSWEARHQISRGKADESAESSSPLLWVKTSLNPIEEVTGEIIGFVGSQRDITRDVMQELRIKKEMGEVMSLAIRRGKELKQSQEGQQKAELEADSRSTFLASMSHEIRTPLNGVLGMTELLLNTNLSNKQQHLADIIHRSGLNLLDLINDILDLSKIDAGKLELNNASHDLRLLIEDVADTFSERANSKGLELTCIYPSSQHALFQCDRQRLTQILTNLVGNAIKFTTAGEVTLQVTLVRDEDEAQLLRFDVIDTGPGIPADKRESIFESFSQIQNSQDQHTKGTGLGLAICKQLANMMGGEIGVDSDFGKGSNFWFTARLVKEVKPDDVIESNDESGLLQGMKILVVDDNATSRDALIQQLKSWDVNVSGAESAIEAINILKRAHKEDAPFNLTMVDQDMPEVSGLNLARMMKDHDVFANTPLILLNSVSDLEETMVWTTAGVKAYLTKPVRQAELYNCLTATLSIPVRKTERQASLEQSRIAQQYNARVLVAEDNTVNQELVSLMLAEFGCDVTIAEDGQQAIDQLNDKNDFDLILMDCLMPVMDGLSATRAIRQLDPNSVRVNVTELPIVALTANAMPDDRRLCEEAGMNDYITKPFSRKKLAEALNQWIKHKQITQLVSGERPAETKAVVAEEVEEIRDTIQDTLSSTVPLEVEENHPAEEIAKTPETTKPTDTVAAAENTISSTFEQKINRKTLDNIRSLQREGAPDILSKIVGLYLDNSKGLLVEIEEAVGEADGKKIRSTAHSLKSSSANLGADILAAICKELELMGKNDELDGSHEKFEELKQEYEAACIALQNETRAKTE